MCWSLHPTGTYDSVDEGQRNYRPSNLVLPQSASVVLDTHPSSVFHLQTLEDQVHLIYVELCGTQDFNIPSLGA